MPTTRHRATALIAAILLALDLGACGAPDTIDTPDGASPDATASGEFILGVNPAGLNDPATFTALADGDDLVVEFGFQGLWMVVLAVKTRGVFTGELLLDAELRVDDAPRGTLALAGQRLASGGDGFHYYFNFFLVVDDPAIAGRPATVRFEASDGHGNAREAIREVNLTGGE